MTKPTKAQVRRDAGFTLFEALVTLGLLALVATVVWPVAVAPAPATVVRTTALRLAADLRSARADALRTGRSHGVTIDLARRAFYREARGPRRTVRQSVVIAVAGRNLAWSSPKAAVIAFRADGSSNGGHVTLRSGAARATVSVDWMTGATTMVRSH